LKYLLSFLIVSVLAACSGEREAKTASSGEQALDRGGSNQDLLTNQNAPSVTSIAQDVSLVKQCRDNLCEGYHLTINQKTLLTIEYATKKKKPASFILTENNAKVLNSLIDQLKVLNMEELIGCLNSNQGLASFSLTLGEASTAKSYLFAIGCEQEPTALKELAQWFDNKAYFVENN
jgi:hypothetical protein